MGSIISKVSSRPKVFISIIVILVLFRARRLVKDSAPRIFHSPNSIFNLILSKCKEKDNYMDVPWLPGGFSTTAIAPLLKFGRALLFCRSEFELIPTPDGGQLGLSWLSKPDASNVEFPIVLSVHGMGGWGDDGNTWGLTGGLVEAGYPVVGLTMRGNWGVPLLNTTISTATSGIDVKTAVDYIYEKFRRKIVLIGNSLGSLQGVHYLADYDTRNILCSIQCCCPMSGNGSSEAMESSLGGLLFTFTLAQWYKGMVIFAKLQYPKIFGDIPYSDFIWINSIRELDRVMIPALVSEYDTAEAYYEDTNVVPKLKNINCPVMFISSLDDPIISKELLPIEECENSDYLCLLSTTHGGHVAFLEGWSCGYWSNSWLSRITAEVVEQFRQLPAMHAKL